MFLDESEGKWMDLRTERFKRRACVMKNLQHSSKFSIKTRSIQDRQDVFNFPAPDKSSGKTNY